jgi:hypothetical protein
MPAQAGIQKFMIHIGFPLRGNERNPVLDCQPGVENPPAAPYIFTASTHFLYVRNPKQAKVSHD